MSDWIRKAITKKLKPVLDEHGFYRAQPKHFVRVRGYLVDNIGFQLSQYGSKRFYLHYFTNLACHPKTSSIINSYYIGGRLDYSEYDDVRWRGDTEDNALNAMESVVFSIDKDVLPWFNKYNTIEKYALGMAGHYRTEFSNIDFLMALMLSGQFGKPYEKIKEMIYSGKELEHSETVEFLWDAMKTPGADKFEKGLLAIEKLRNNNLRDLKLDRFIT